MTSGMTPVLENGSEVELDPREWLPGWSARWEPEGALHLHRGASSRAAVAIVLGVAGALVVAASAFAWQQSNEAATQLVHPLWTLACLLLLIALLVGGALWLAFARESW